MNKTLKKSINLKNAIMVLALAFSLFSLDVMAQSTPKTNAAKRLKAQSTVNGNIGGESHDSYVVRARKGQTLKVQILWQPEDNNKAHFVVSRSPDFFAGDLVEGGRETYDGTNWTGKVRATRDYHIYVTAHPQATYKLKVSVR